MRFPAIPTNNRVSVAKLNDDVRDGHEAVTPLLVRRIGGREDIRYHRSAVLPGRRGVPRRAGNQEGGFSQSLDSAGCERVPFAASSLALRVAKAVSSRGSQVVLKSGSRPWLWRALHRP